MDTHQIISSHLKLVTENLQKMFYPPFEIEVIKLLICVVAGKLSNLGVLVNQLRKITFAKQLLKEIYSIY